MSLEDVIDNILDEVLAGIDEVEGDTDDGWWETSVGAAFGATKKSELRERIVSEVSRFIEGRALEQADEALAGDGGGT